MIRVLDFIVIRLWFLNLGQAMRCVLQQNTSFHVAPVHSAGKNEEFRNGRAPLPGREFISHETEKQALKIRNDSKR